MFVKDTLILEVLVKCHYFSLANKWIIFGRTLLVVTLEFF